MVLLSFDIEEFDLPLECKGSISKEEQINVCRMGLERIVELLDKYQIKATFFCTAYFAETSGQVIRSLVEKGHEIASHGHYHDQFEIKHLSSSKQILERIAQTQIEGFRMARMMPLDESEITKAGYLYNSSLNPTFMPGRYNHWREPRTWFRKEGLFELPASVTPSFRIPLFWLSLHLFPLSFYQYLLHRTLKKDGYAVLYFHPWEFSDQLNTKHYNIPSYIQYHSGNALLLRLEKTILYCLKRGYSFARHTDFVKIQL